jgi:hypothetical protein
LNSSHVLISLALWRVHNRNAVGFSQRRGECNNYVL